MRKGRIDYRMARRAVLRDVVAGMRAREDVCDAHPDLLRAGASLGDEVAEACPVCRDGSLRHVTYVFFRRGPRQQRGRAIRRDALTATARQHGDLNVYTVEVCLTCQWHHLIESFWLTRQRRPAVGQT